MKTTNLLAAIFCVSIFVSQPLLAASCTEPQGVSQLKDVAGQLLEKERRRAGASRMSRDARLDQAAQVQACYVARTGYKPTAPHRGRNGSNVMDRVVKAGYRTCLTAENLAVNITTSQAAVDIWMNSPGHRANIVLGSIREYGLGVAMMGNQPVWIMVLAKPC